MHKLKSSGSHESVRKKEEVMKRTGKINKLLFEGGLILFLLFTLVGHVTAQDCVPPPSGLVGWWPLDETGGTSASDIIAGNDGIYINGPTPVAGMVGGGLSFDGIDDYVMFPTAPFYGKPTIDMWIKTSTKSNAIMDGGNRYRTWRIGINAAGQATYTHFFMPSCCIDYYITITGTTVVSDGEFHHIATVADQDTRTISLYVDGILEASRTPVEEGGWAGSALGYIKLGKNDAQWLPGPLYYTGIVDELGLYDRPLTASEIQGIYNAGSTGMCKAESECVTPPSGLMSWWDGDAVSGTTASDIQDGNDGTLVNGVTTVPGKVGDAFSFDGVNDHINVGQVLGFDANQPWSLTAWVNPVDPAKFQPVVGRQSQTQIPGYLLSIGGWDNIGEFMVAFLDNSVSPVNSVRRRSVGTIPANTWTHIAATYDGSNTVEGLHVYRNGILDDGVTLGSGGLGTIDYTGVDFLIGTRDGNESTFVMDGEIDEVTVFNRSLSTEEIQAIYNAGSAGKCKGVPPVAQCKDVTVDAGTDCSTAGASIDNGSHDPDGDDITITQNPAGPYGLGETEVTLTVTDESGESDSCTAIVTVEDNSCPAVTARLVPVKVKKKKGCFRVELSVADNCDEDPQVVATINGTNGAGVVDGQLVELKHKKKFKVKTDDGDSGSSSSDDDSISDDCGFVRFEGPVFTLSVRVIDSAGNFCDASDTFIFDGDSNSHDDDSSSDDDVPVPPPPQDGGSGGGGGGEVPW